MTWLLGDRVRVENAEGAVIADGIAVDQLEAVDPFLYYACIQAIARTQPDARFDARFDITGGRSGPRR